MKYSTNCLNFRKERQKNVKGNEKSTHTLREKCPNTELFLVRIFLYSDWIRRFTINLRIQSEDRKIRTRNNSVFGHFSRSNSSMEQKILLLFMMEWNILVFNAIAWKVLKYGVFSGRYFPTFGLNTERCSVSLRIQSKCGKIQTRRKKSVIGHFSCSVLFSGSLHFQPFWNSCPRNCYDVMNKLFFHQSTFDLSIKLSIVGSETGKMKSMM